MDCVLAGAETHYGRPLNTIVRFLEMAFGLLNQPIRAQDVGTLDEIGALLHDETCGVDDLVWDEAKKTLLLPFRRQFHGGEERVLTSGPMSTVYEKHWMRSEVLVRNVLAWEKFDDQGIGDYSFNEWSLDGDRLTIAFCEALVMTIEVSQLDITMTDLGFNGRARIERFIGGAEASTGQVF
jgi:hypothetical protein